MTYVKVVSNIIRETEKAYQLTVSYWTKVDKPAKEAKMWCPKSCCKTEDGKVVEVAEFILNNWEKEHNDYIRSYTRVIPNISFDMAAKEARLANMKEQEQREKEVFAERVARISAKAEPYATKFMQELGLVCGGASEALRAMGRDAAACDDLASLGKKIRKAFGDYNNDETALERCVDNYKGYTEAEIHDAMYMMLDTWIFDNLRVSYDNTVERSGFTHSEFFSVSEHLKSKVFKKNTEFKRLYSEAYGRIWQQ